MVSQLSITEAQYHQIQAAEAVAVSNYRTLSTGLQFSKLARIGTVAECNDFVETPALLLVMSHVEYLGSEVVLTKNLLPPDTSAPL